MQLQRREREGVTLLDLSGKFVAGPPVAAFRQALQELQSSSRLNVVLNLAGVDYLDSTALGALVLAHGSLKQQGGRLVLLNLNPRHLELLVLTKLATVLEIFDDEQQAINSFFPGRQVRRFDVLQFVQQMRGESPADTADRPAARGEPASGQDTKGYN